MAKYKKNKDGYYNASIPTGEYNAQGNPLYKRFRAKTIAELEKKIEEYREQQRLHVVPVKMILDEWFDVWLSTYKTGIRENTLSFYKTLYSNHVSPKIGSMRIADIRNVHCQSLLAEMEKKGLSHRTIKGVRGILSSLFETACLNGYLAVNPAVSLKANGKEKKERRALTKEERERFLASCLKDPFGIFAAFLFWFGLRRGEALALTGRDIKDGYVHIDKQHTFPTNNKPQVGPPKTPAGYRDIPIPLEARKYIDFDGLPDGLIFVNGVGNPYSYSEYVDRWNHFIQSALGEDTEVTAHYLRHNYATMLCEADIPLMAAKRYCSHDSAETTLNIYQHCSETIKDKADAMMFSFGGSVE